MTIETRPPASAAPTIAAYAACIHAVPGDAHHVASPLGAWLLLALVAPLAGGADRAEIEAALGCPAADARRLAEALLGADHPCITAALAVWARTSDLGDTLAAWRDAMPPRAECGPVPAQADADAWAARHTNGRITHFPPLAADTVLVLASALATDVRWDNEYSIAAAEALGGHWNGRVEFVLSNPVNGRRSVARTHAAGLVGVHEQRAENGLDVLSVIAPPEASAADTLAAAYELAEQRGRGENGAFVSLFDLPLEGHAWRITEHERESIGQRPPAEYGRVWLPAWEAASDGLALTNAEGTGLGAAVRTVLSLLPRVPTYRASVTQSARARYDVRGFWAAAVTDLRAMGMAGRFGRPPEQRYRVVDREIELRFSRPFAAVAFASADSGPPAWRGVPVFGAWVAEACEPDAEEHQRRWARSRLARALP